MVSTGTRIRVVIAALAVAVMIGFSAVLISMKPMQPVQAARVPTEEEFQPSKYKGKTGKIVLANGSKEFQLYLYNAKANRYLITKTVTGTMIVPAGDHTLAGYMVVTGIGKNKWYAQCQPKDPVKLAVKPGTTKKLNYGPPFTASVAVGQMVGSRVVMDFKMVDSGGWKASIRPVGRSGSLPKFQVLSKYGKVIWQGTFRYG